ncbi:MAG: polyhydroxyalkanoate synthesis repressor PhaR [Hyphomicrobiales bacterium]
MTASKKPTIIKKYANRRLYHTGTSTYVTLDDLAGMVKQGDEFLVQDAKTGEDITRSVLTQIIFEQEGKAGQNLLPIAFLRQLIGYYGDSMQALVPSYLDYSIKALSENQQKFRDQMSTAFGPGSFGVMDEHVQKNMAMFRDAMSMFTPFGLGGAVQTSSPAGRDEETRTVETELEALKREMAEMQKRLSKLAGG